MEFLNTDISGSYKEENLYRAAVIRVRQCTVVIVMKVYAVQCNESTAMTDKGMLVLQDSAHSQEDVPGSYTETSSHDAHQAINIKVEEVSDVEEEEDPVPISFPGIKTEHAVSSFFSFPADSRTSAAACLVY
jgi:hypothetical protein